MSHPRLVVGVGWLLLCAACTREGLLGPDHQPTSEQSTPPDRASKPLTPQPSGPPPLPSPADRPQPGEDPVDTTTWQATRMALTSALEAPGCTNAAALATRLNTIWTGWYQDRNRRAQPDYEAMVLQPMEGVARRCGTDYALTVYATLDHSSPDIPARINATIPDVSDSGTPGFETKTQ